MAQVNPYYPGIALRNFPKLNAEIEDYYDMLFDTVVPDIITPRYVYEHGKRVGFRDIFYYIDMLYDNKPQTLIDVGCGECTWKRWFPNIIGFDPNKNQFSQADFVDMFDRDFAAGHRNHYDVGMAICSIHFIDWDYVPTQIELAMSIVKDRFLFTFNFHQLQNKPRTSFDQQVEMFYQMVESTDFKILMFDEPTARDCSLENTEHWFYTNGTVRFILGHK